MAVHLKVKSPNHGDCIPRRATSGSCGVDLRNIYDDITITNRISTIDTGICVEIPHGYFGKLEARSSLAKKGLLLLGGVIDNDYRSSIKVLCTSIDSDIVIKKGGYFVQIIIIPYLTTPLQVVDSLSKTKRMGGGFGSTD